MPTLHATSSDSLQQLVACSRELYSLPRVAIKVLELTEQANVDIPALRACLEHDPALTTKVLRVVNSSLFGLPRQVGDLNHALTLLGVKPLKMLVLGFSLPPNLFAGLEAEVLQQYWRRTIIKAVAARDIARRWGTVDSEELLIAGLLQDIGVLVLLQQLGEPYCRFVKHAWEAGNQLVLLERELFGFDHAEITARLLSSWRLPKPLVAAVRTPETLAGTCPQSTTVLWLAELVASFLCSGDPELLASLYQSFATWKHVSAESVEQFLVELQVQVEQLASVYLNQSGTDLDYAALVAQARARVGAQSQSLSELLALQAREVHLDREQWRELLESLKALPPAAAKPLDDRPAPLSEADEEAQQPPPRVRPSLPELPREAAPLNMLFASRDSANIGSPFLRQVTRCAASCRIMRVGLSLMLIEVDRAEETLLTRGVSYLPQLREDCEAWLNQWLPTPTEAIPLGDNYFALLLQDTEQMEASMLGRRLIDVVSHNAHRESQYSTTTLSIGVASIALLPKNFDASNLVNAAQRCLQGAKLSGGACLKSIEIY